MRKMLAVIAILCLVLLGACAAEERESATVSPSEAPSEVSAIPSYDAAPTIEGEFVFTRENFPRMDGSTATVPLGQAVASVLLGEPRDQVADLALFNKTTQSFRNLMNGYADILIVGEPNADVFTEMDEAGFDYEMSSIATDALVFIVNADNPVDSLTTEQIQKIYTGEITNWEEVGGADLEIEAFQRNAAAGSQALMEKLVMQGLVMAAAPEDHMDRRHGGAHDRCTEL